MVPGNSTRRVKIKKIRPQQAAEQQDVVAVEEPLQITLAQECSGGACNTTETTLALTMRTPGDDFNLAAGFLFSEGIIRHKDDIHRISYCVGREKEKQQYNYLTVALRPHVKIDPNAIRNFYTTSACGVCGKSSIDALKQRGLAPLPPQVPRVTAAVLNKLPGALRAEQDVFEKTGGLHAAGLFTPDGKLLRLCEDVGRHNAVDKLIGAELLDGKVPLHDRIVVVSGRLSFEIVQKVAIGGVPILAAVGAPSSLAVELAEEVGMTLVGFLRNESFNIYSAPQRLT